MKSTQKFTNHVQIKLLFTGHTQGTQGGSVVITGAVMNYDNE